MDCMHHPRLTCHHQLLELAHTYVHCVGDAIQPSHLLSSPSPPAFSPNIRGFSCESVLHIRWPKNWSFSFSISPSNEYSGLISFIIDWFISLQFKGLSRVFSNTHEHYEIMVFILCPKTLGSLPVLMRISIKKAEVCIAIINTYLIISSW